jgi:carotenoid cleavage dioxygenase-like enzyme
MTEAPGTLHRYTADLTKKSLTREVLDYAMAEFPTTNPYRHIGGSGGSIPARYVCANHSP